MKVLFAPDWQRDVPYQRLLAAALRDEGIDVEFLSGYRRLFPLARAVPRAGCDLLHLHWPEAYYARMFDGYDLLRRARFPLDLRVATRKTPLVVTAHNLHTHNRAGELFEHRNYRTAMRHARAVIAHSAPAKAELVERFGIDPARCHAIRHGDLSVEFGQPPSRSEARAALGLGEEKVCLMFGAIEPYKGIEEALALWKAAAPNACLVIAGKPISDDYAGAVERLASDVPGTRVRPGWMDDLELARWLSAADCVLFNYRAIFTSGAATLARSWGVPLLLPSRLTTIDLDEPDPRVFRFEATNFGEQLGRALAAGSDYSSAAVWREKGDWRQIARLTAAVYRGVLE
jgi:glycosyltransferase involved in cell wall biosynthesis